MSDLIDRQKAIDALAKAGLVNYAATGDGNGMIHAVNVIKALPSAQPTFASDINVLNKDLISRQAAIDVVSGIDRAFVKYIKNLPSAQPERKIGKWILIQEADETGNAYYQCPFCHKGECHVPIVEVKYCWNCGAEMEGSAV